MDRKTILYRGSLKSCNYACSYCPFAKHSASCREQERDKKDWMKFWQSLEARAKDLGAFALMVVPYGEALLYPWYWEGLAKLSRLKQAEAVGVQTNLSFSLEDALVLWERAGGKKEKLRLWASFHPEMVSPEAFAQKCRKVAGEGIALCAGAVGVPQNLPVLKKLRCLLPDSLYLWINAMDGLQRPYTREEEQAFAALDPFFVREQEAVPANPEHCTDRLFIEGNGRMHTCNISSTLPKNWYQEDFSFPPPRCRNRWCTCYLAYGIRADWINSLLFGPYPLFRIPRFFGVWQTQETAACPKVLTDAGRRFLAVFLDIDGTLIPQGEKEVPPFITAGLKALFGMGTRLFFATSLPMPEARRKCLKLWPLFSGGIFAGGAHILWGEEIFYFLEDEVLAEIQKQRARFHCRICTGKSRGKLYKISLSRKETWLWSKEEEHALRESLPGELGKKVRFIREGHILQIIPAQASKENGVTFICKKLGIPLGKTAAVGNSAGDEAMLALCGEGIRIKSLTVGKNNH